MSDGHIVGRLIQDDQEFPVTSARDAVNVERGARPADFNQGIGSDHDPGIVPIGQRRNRKPRPADLGVAVNFQVAGDTDVLG